MSPFAEGLAVRLRLRLLVADDNAVNQKVALMMLKRFGYSADAVGNGTEVLVALETKTNNIVLLDVQMPEMDGYETARRICAIGRKQGCTAMPDRDDRECHAGRSRKMP